ncbi:glycogen synthase [Streptomyces sp. NPDC059740]|uniref:glycogen synthase n=1 Tax=Streptomyces sp. NPDC059740 TaxID=3346926 RepID=UPI00366A057A
MRGGAALRVHFATSEVHPLVKVGGLGDVAQALPRALARRGHQVRLYLPRYDGMPRGHPVTVVRAQAGGVHEEFDVEDQGDHAGVRYYSLAARHHAGWGRPEGYVEKNLALYVLFCRALAALAARPALRPDVVHCNDWHVGHLPARLKETGHPARSVMTIHNLAYQGLFPHDTATDLGLARYGTGNLLAQGIAHADVVTTVSDRYRSETLTPEWGEGLHELLAARGDDYHGVLNGVDYAEFDPSTDVHLPARFDVDDMSGKAACKSRLQRAAGLAEEPDTPVIAFVGRLVKQKGVELLLSSVDELAATGAQFVFVGRGELYEHAFARAARFHAAVGYLPDSTEPAARLAYAGSDAFLAPSEFEPCGLAPLIALRYGSVPVVRAVGGMVDTLVRPRRGFSFPHGRTQDLVSTVDDVLKHMRDRPAWNALRAAGMRARFSWDEAAAHYERLYTGEWKDSA